MTSIWYEVNQRFGMEEVMNKVRLFLQNHPRTHKVMFYISSILLVCFIFIFWTSYFPFDFWITFLVIVAYGVIGRGFVVFYGMNREKFVYKIVYITSLIFAGLGMISRYIFSHIIEHGDVTAPTDFTSFNIIAFLIASPIFTVVAYHLLSKYLLEKK